MRLRAGDTGGSLPQDRSQTRDLCGEQSHSDRSVHAPTGPHACGARSCGCTRPLLQCMTMLQRREQSHSTVQLSHLSPHSGVLRCVCIKISINRVSQSEIFSQDRRVLSRTRHTIRHSRARYVIEPGRSHFSCRDTASAPRVSHTYGYTAVAYTLYGQ